MISPFINIAIIGADYGVRTYDLGINDNLIHSGEVITSAKNGKRQNENHSSDKSKNRPIGEDSKFTQYLDCHRRGLCFWSYSFRIQTCSEPTLVNQVWMR